MFQYLILNNHLQSAKSYKQVSNLTWKQHLISAFSKGHRQSFFKIFQLLRKQEKLEFYLRVYFLIYPIHPTLSQNHKNITIPEKEINSFREFLDTKGADLAKTSQFLQFYALPFIKKPLEHATFKTLFTKIWVTNLKQKLLTYIQIQQEQMKQSVKSLTSSLNSSEKPSQNHQNILQKGIHTGNIPVQTSQKYKKLQQKNKQLFEQLQLIKQNYQSLEQNHQSMIQSFNEYMMDSQNKWFESYKELVKTAKGLIQILSNTHIQNPKYERRYLQAKKRIDKYDKFVAKKLQDLMSLSQDISVFDKPSINQISQYTVKSGFTSKSWLPNSISNKNPTNQNNITTYLFIDEYISTNFQKLNSQFAKLSDYDRQVIIEGFCWRLIKAKSKQIKRLYCVAMIQYNFLGLGKTDDKSQVKELEVCSKYLRNQKFTLQVLEMINYLKSDYYSRQHLFLKNNITWQLLEIIGDSLERNEWQSFSICLDIVSTVSAYQDYRNSILQTSLPIFLLQALQAYPTIFQHQELMQPIMMIFMNSSTFDQGVKMFQQFQNIFSVLSLAFYQPHHDIIILVNGFYYALLSNKNLYDLAIKSNMPAYIDFLLNSPDYKDHQKQLKFIQARLQKFQTKEPTFGKKSDENQDDYFLIDGEEDDNEFQQPHQEEMENLQRFLKGHQMLSNKYILRDKQADQQQKNVIKINQIFVDEIKRKNQLEQKRKLREQQKRKEQQKQNQQQKNILKNIPEEKKLKKPNNTKTQQVQISQVPMIAKSKQPQQSIRQQIFNSPLSKLQAEKQQIQGNSKEAQFMGLLNKQKNPTFAKQKQSPQQMAQYSTPMTQNQNLPNFGNPILLSQAGPQQKSRRKQILKQINEEIQIKKNMKGQKHEEKKQKNKSKSTSQNNVLDFGQKGNFSKKVLIDQNHPDWGKGVRSNLHIKNKQPINEKTKQQAQKQRKAFESKPKIRRTPPKQENQL